jgi:hypothetical protein
MRPLVDDIVFLQRAADTAGLVIYPGKPNRTFDAAANLSVSFGSLSAIALEAESRRIAPRAYRLIDYPAVWLLQSAGQLVLHKQDGNELQATRYAQLGAHLRMVVEADLDAARKSLGEE